MFNVADESSNSSHEDCDGECSCSDDEAYLDQLVMKKYEDSSHKKKVQADPEEYLEYNFKGIEVPIRMRKDSEAVQISDGEQAEMDTDSPFPPTLIKTVVTDPIITTRLSSETTISASAEAIAIVKQQEKHKKSNRKLEKSALRRHHTSGTITPQMRPPPSTPLEDATFPYTLSTPNLPVFHHYTDDVLLQRYQVERVKDPVAFDLQTTKIKQYLVNAKIERGGVGYLEESEYSVDLASREDARKVQRMAVQRRRGMTETETNVGHNGVSNSSRRPPEYSELPAVQATQAASPTGIECSAEDALQITANDIKSDPRSNIKVNPKTSSKKSTSTLPEDFDFAKHVAKYTTSGSMRHQHSRKVIEDETGTKTTLKTWIEITQDISVPSADQLSWEDVKTARRNVQATRKEAKAKKTEDETDTDNEDEADEQHASTVDAKELLGAIATIKGTGRLSRGVSLGQYLRQVKKDVQQSSKGMKANAGGSGDESD